MPEMTEAIYKFPGAQILKPKVGFIKDEAGEIRKVVTISFNVLDLSPGDVMELARAALLEHPIDAHIQLWQPPLPTGTPPGRLP